MTGLSQPLDNSLYPFRHQLAHGDVVQEEERLGAAGKDIINTVIDQVNADGIMSFQGAGDLELGTDPVSTGDQDRLLKSLKFKKAAKEPRAS